MRALGGIWHAHYLGGAPRRESIDFRRESNYFFWHKQVLRVFGKMQTKAHAGLLLFYSTITPRPLPSKEEGAQYPAFAYHTTRGVGSHKIKSSSCGYGPYALSGGGGFCFDIRSIHSRPPGSSINAFATAKNGTSSPPSYQL